MVKTAGYAPLLAALWRIQKRDELTARELAKRIGVAEATVSRYRSSDRKPSGEVVRRIVRSYPELLDSLLAGEEAGPVATSGRA